MVSVTAASAGSTGARTSTVLVIGPWDAATLNSTTLPPAAMNAASLDP